MERLDKEGIGDNMSENKELQRFGINAPSKDRACVLLGNEMVTVEYFLDHLALDIAEELKEIKQGTKKREETTIDLDMKVLNSLSSAVNALANFRNS